MLCLWVCGFVPFAQPPDNPTTQPPYVVVESVASDSPAAKAGVKVGDRLLTYDGKPLPSPAAFRASEQNTLGKKEVALRLQRGSETLTLTVPLGTLGIAVRPELPPDALKLYEQGNPSRDGDGAVKAWTAAAKATQDAGDKAAAAWLHGGMGRIYESQRKWKEAQEAHAAAWELLKNLTPMTMDAAAQSVTLAALGRCSANLNDLPAALRWYEQARQVDEAAGNEMWAAGDLTNLGLVTYYRGNLRAAQDYFIRALNIQERLAPDSLDVAGSLNNLGAVARDRGDLNAAHDYHTRALTIRERLAPDSLALADSLNNLGIIAYERGDLTATHNYFTRALKIYERLAPDSLVVAGSLNNLGAVAYERGDLSAAHDYHTRALTIRERLVPDSLFVADSLNNLGAVASQRGDLTAAHDYYTRALTIRERLAPDSLAVAASLTNLGLVARDRSDLSAAHDYLTRALTIRERLAPDSLDVARSLTNLGNVAYERGDLSEAHDYHTRALKIFDRLAPDSLDVARSLTNLGNVAWQRGDLNAAHDYHTRALTIRERLAPDSLDVAHSLNALGIVASQRGDLTAAHDYYTRALTIRERLAPDSLTVAHSLNNLGIIARNRGNLNAAHNYHTRALKIKEQLAPDSLDVAYSLTNLGVVAEEGGDLSGARDYYTRALTIRERLAPDSLDVADVLNNVGRIALHERRFPEAVNYYIRAITLVESQRRQIASPEERALLVEQHTQPYTGLLKTYLARHDVSAAFATIERARARSLVEMLAERDVDFSADAPKELLQRRLELEWKRDAAYKQLSKLNPNKDEARIEQLRADLTSLAVAQRQLVADIQRASPQYAALQYPQPLDLKGAQAALDAGTLLLSYYVDEKETYLFVVKGKEGEVRGSKGKQGEVRGSKGQEGDASPLHPFTPSPLQSIQLFRLKVTEKELRERVEEFRVAVSHPRGRFERRGSELYDLLVRPAQSLVDKAQRVLICPDGPLHTLPFGALIKEEIGKLGNGGNGRARYFVEAKPLHTIVSMSVYAEIRKQSQIPNTKSQTPNVLLALGDPVYDASSESVKKDFQTRGGKLTPLPNTRLEVEAIGRLYGKQATVWVGKDANETVAKSESGKASVLHFACHGILDNRDPFASALALTPSEGTRDGKGEDVSRPATPDTGPATDDGMLRAYEILEKVRLNADLVVLSACESGLGEATKHEGIVGMTRAFQYAGAKSVVVSLWNVADESTAPLMTEFYRQLKSGKSKDAALRAAQLSLLRSNPKSEIQNPKWNHPFHWAAFVLVGEWR